MGHRRVFLEEVRLEPSPTEGQRVAGSRTERRSSRAGAATFG